MQQLSSSYKSLERLVSQRALEMSSYVSCKVGVVCFLCGVCVTYLLLAAMTSFRGFDFESLVSTPAVKAENATGSLTLVPSSDDTPLRSSCVYMAMGRGSGITRNRDLISKRRDLLLYTLWDSLLEGKGTRSSGFNRSNVPEAPHMENCQFNVQIHRKLDERGENGSLPPWRNWRALLGFEQTQIEKGEAQEGAYPPWIVGSDEDNLPLTRQVQQDIWMHQHPRNCSDPNVRFLVADWQVEPGFGLGAQIAGMCGLLSIAINEQRVLVTNYFNRADHEGCKGPARSRWSCYFAPEVSTECRNQAMKLLWGQKAWSQNIVTLKDNYSSKAIWAGRVPRIWGTPWDDLQPTTEIDGNLLKRHRKMDRRWWRSQVGHGKLQAEMENHVWAYHRPWIPRPILSVHVRMGDKASEMKVVGFEAYMQLSDRVRRRFPNLKNIWLSTEMQEIIDKLRFYPQYKFYYTNVTRQEGNMTMAAYEASLGREISTNNALVNFLMAADADFFIGALGSTWCYLIDGMRNTAGKIMAGYLSVNKDRFW
ncbi:uncharacterized protein LOC116266322 isoform X2 [Nymphaea colorata]|uniref:uncharacterized protein LOC116266322 isoform X2 n=1 Tax=Nymphaea colorata TaxID=210225 RepID=UPI00129D6988|nr:uncharacterized protein LOC116266322 isoform X2 [Nymphaea colorata]